MDAVDTLRKSRPTLASCESESPPSFLTPAEFLEFVARLVALRTEGRVEHGSNGLASRTGDTMCRTLKGQRQR